MSNVTLFNPAQVPDFVRARGRELSAMAKALAGGGDTGKRISIKGGVFRLIDAGKEIAAVDERFLDVVIVNAAPKVSRVFFLKAYDPDSPAAPDCWSPDGDTPSDTAAHKQAARCADCKQNIKGSGKDDSRACRFQQRLAVVLANDMEGAVMNLTAPALSIFGKEDGENRPLQAYARYLLAQNVDPSEVVTRMKFDTKAESPKLFFKAMRWLDNEEYAVCKKQGESEDAIKAITFTVAQMDGTKTASADVQQELGARPQRAAEPEPEPTSTPKPKAPVDDEPPPPSSGLKKATGRTKKAEAPQQAAEEVEEPTVRETKQESPAPQRKSSLAAMVDDWDK